MTAYGDDVTFNILVVKMSSPPSPWVYGDQDLLPVDAEVTILPRISQDPAPPPSAENHRLNPYILQAQSPQVVPDPIQLRGVGSTTL